MGLDVRGVESLSSDIRDKWRRVYLIKETTLHLPLCV